MDNNYVYLHSYYNYKYILHNKNSYDTHTCIGEAKGGLGEAMAPWLFKISYNTIKKNHKSDKKFNISPP